MMLDLSAMGMRLITIAPDGSFVNGKQLYVDANQELAPRPRATAQAARV